MAEERIFQSPRQKGWFYITKYILIVALALAVVDLVFDLKDVRTLRPGVITVMVVALIYVIIGFIGVLMENFIFVFLYAILMALGEILAFILIAGWFSNPIYVVSFVLALLVMVAAFSFALILYRLKHPNAIS